MGGEVILPTACRCCLMEDKDMVYVFDILDEFSMQISELIVRNGAITILENDAFSKHICGNCLNDLAIAERFIVRCRKTNELLSSIVVKDLQDDSASVLEANDMLSCEDISYVLVSPGHESALYDDIIEEQSPEMVEDCHDILHTGNVDGKDEDSSKKRVGAVEAVQLVYTNKILNECDTMINEEEIEIDDQLFAELLAQNRDKDLPEMCFNIDDPSDSVQNSNTMDSDEAFQTKLITGTMLDYKHTCNHCGASFVITKNYARHLRSHNIIACEKCLEIFDSEKKCAAHIVRCTRDHEIDASYQNEHQETVPSNPNNKERKKTFICSYCDKRWVSQSALTAHQRTHTGERPFSCRYCPKSFKTLASVDLHERRHSGSKPYSCPVCDKRFTDSSNLKVHLLQHTKEKPHVCTVCNRAFARVFLLQLHMRTHTGEKPYACDACGQRFAQQGDLTTHRRTHSGERPHVCNVCGKSFTKSSAAKVHSKSHQRHVLTKNVEMLSNPFGNDTESLQE